MKRILLFVFCSLALSQIDAAVPAQSSHEFKSEFVKRMNSERVTQANGKLVLFADPSMLRIIGLSAGSVLLVGLGAVPFLIDMNRARAGDRFAFYFWSAICAVAGVVLGKMALESIERRVTPTPVLVLDNDTITSVADGKKVKWSEVSDLGIEKITEYHDGARSTSWDVISLKDKFGTSLMDISTHADTMLPLESSNLMALFRHYMDESKRQAVQINQ